MLRRTLQLGCILIALGITSLAADIACLRNGFAIRHDRHEVIGDKTRLYIGNGYIDILSSEIERFEPDDSPVIGAPAAPSAASATTINQHVAEASRASGIDRDFLESVIHYESGFNPKAVSPKGARGLMQLMPDTADQLGVKDSFDPKQNIQGGTTYLKQLLELYHGDAQKALAAYNAGPHRVEQYRGVPPYRETRVYVSRIIREFNQKKNSEKRTAAVARTKPQPTKRAVQPKTSKGVEASSGSRRPQPGS